MTKRCYIWEYDKDEVTNTRCRDTESRFLYGRSIDLGGDFGGELDGDFGGENQL